MRLQPSRKLLLAPALALLVHAASPFPAAALPPAQGPAVPQLAAFDRLMQEFMDKHDISAGQLAILRNGAVVLDRAYGWQNKTRDVPPHQLKPLRPSAPSSRRASSRSTRAFSASAKATAASSTSPRSAPPTRASATSPSPTCCCTAPAGIARSPAI